MFSIDKYDAVISSFISNVISHVQYTYDYCVNGWPYILLISLVHAFFYNFFLVWLQPFAFAVFSDQQSAIGAMHAVNVSTCSLLLYFSCFWIRESYNWSKEICKRNMEEEFSPVEVTTSGNSWHTLHLFEIWNSEFDLLFLP